MLLVLFVDIDAQFWMTAYSVGGGVWYGYRGVIKVFWKVLVYHNNMGQSDRQTDCRTDNPSDYQSETDCQMAAGIDRYEM